MAFLEEDWDLHFQVLHILNKFIFVLLSPFLAFYYFCVYTIKIPLVIPTLILSTLCTLHISRFFWQLFILSFSVCQG